MLKRKVIQSAIFTHLCTLPLYSNTTLAIELEEIIVTANKRSESANDVGLSIAAVSGEKLKDQKLASLEEITSAVPGLVFATSTANTPIFTLRGIGFNEQTLGAYPATSLYLDEAPMPFPVLASHAAYDLERMEVLKGPQGILFGQNSTGGAINFIAAKPRDEFEAGGDVSYGRFDKVEVNGFVSGPLTEALGARFSFTTANADEWQKSTSSDDENGAEEYHAERLILTYNPTDTSRYLVNINGWKDQSDPQAQQYIAINPQIPIDAVTGLPPENLGTLLAEPFVSGGNRDADWSKIITNSPRDDEASSPFEPSSERDFYQVVLRGDWDLNNNITLTALTTYADFKQQQQTDGDGSALVLFDLERTDATIDTWITEFRIAGEFDQARWVVGINQENSDTFEESELRYIDGTNYTLSNNYINGSSIRIDQSIESSALFANLDYDVTDDLVFKLGARYTESEIDAVSCNHSTGDGAVAELFNMLGAAFGGGTLFTPIGEYPDCYSLNYQGLPGDPFVDTLAEENVSWRLGTDFHLNDETLLYANISKGYKSGSYPAIAAAFWTQLEPVTQESVLSYEAGFKTSMLDNRVQLNGAAFRYEYKDKQLRTKVLDPVFGFLDILDNVPETEISGLEADITALLSESLTFTASVTYLDSKVTDYKGVSFTSEAQRNNNGLLELIGGTEDFAGDPIPLTPEWTYSMDLDYRTALQHGGTLFAGVNLSGQSQSEAAFGGGRLRYNESQLAQGAASITPYFNEMDGYTVWGARLGYESPEGHWRVMLWGKNLADEYYVTNVISSSDTSGRLTGRPRSYGITLGYNY
ncbi:TonB-dependent receptor [Pseudomaricurvus alkylphenolicus]|uniref:TonB-dependent receptor n=1 Tax=Pseudomaricurvus alkylphenolicus TaxID=1306991 RepID=UPI00141E6731|nr:TonB-dependent receptor [Pseudomaricurvus alkylphenolicus]NIB44128.1 TonB-dependent receptor [Pseudomaricurvus alkylphenolicus]